jgi:exodeoxyribonuclease VII large subunit
VLAQEQARRSKEFRDLIRRLADAGQRNILHSRRKIDAMERLRQTLGYEATLERGFAVVRDSGTVVTDTKAAGAASALEIQFKDGRILVGGKPSPSKRSGSKPPEQGSLF